MSETPKGRGLRIVLFVSLAFNLLVVGVVVGLALGGGPLRSPVAAGPGTDTALPYIRALDEQQRRALRGTFRRELIRDRREAGALRQELLGGYRDAVAILRAEPFDRPALETVLEEQSELGAEARARGQVLLGRFLAGLPPEERAAYADRLEAEVTRRAQRRAPPGRGPEPDG